MSGSQYFATHEDYRINEQGQIDRSGQGWLNALPNADNLHPETGVAKNLNAALLTPLRALLDFARIKTEISPSDESLLTVLQEPTTATQKKDSLLFTITRWNQTALNDVVTQFSSNIAGFEHFDLLRRVYDAFALIQKMGISAKALIQATTNEPTADIVRDLQAGLRARYDAAGWRDVVRPINDEMRSLQRDALVAYILHQMRSHQTSEHIDTPEKLFEYFLMDVEMDPCMQTSRIRHALSSVQLFIERCLMKLEWRVSPTAIEAKQWEWRKRYRVWEANRKVFLWPENWLEPELRDDKSPFFKEIESELLQSDITEDSAATALLNYLSKLEEVAKLEPCGIYHVEGKDIDHVVARTAGAHRKYYYRRREGSSWTPWEQIKLDIEDDPVVPVVWNDRLLLFWLRILKKGSDAVRTPFSNIAGDTSLNSLTISKINTNPPPVMVEAMLCWSEYYNNKWQPPKTSDINHPTFLGQSDPSALETFRSKLVLTAIPEAKGLRVRIFMGYSGWGSKQMPQSSFLLYNTHSLPVPQEETGSVPFSPVKQWRFLPGLFAANDNLEIYYWNDKNNLNHKLLLGELPIKITRPDHTLKNPWTAPFFCEDSHHVFFVTTKEQQVPWTGFVIRSDSDSSKQVSPIVIYKEVKDEFKPIPPVISGLELISPAWMQQVVREDADIRYRFETADPVSYRGKRIEFDGSLSKDRART